MVAPVVKGIQQNNVVANAKHRAGPPEYCNAGLLLKPQNPLLEVASRTEHRAGLKTLCRPP